MHEIKIENFHRFYPDKIFPAYRELTLDECKAIVAVISEKYCIRANDSLEFVLLLDQRQSFIESENADSDSFDLRRVFEKLQIKPLDEVFINWYRFDQMDSISFDDLAKYFDDIWYPSADDIDIVDSSLEWILQIDHDGYIKVLK
jgi:hypothetical protein